jgi:NAD(P)-dependent dehydrogenase (short-subunit alcohol dehydrogenase family)
MSAARFSGKNIIITGAAGNFGREGCKYFVEQGACVVGLDKDECKLMETVQYAVVGQKSDKVTGFCEGIACDITNAESVTDAVQRAADFFQRVSHRPVIDYLWNNAGYQGQIAPTLDYDPVDFATVMNINVTGMFIVLQAVAKRMAAATTNSASATDAGGDSTTPSGFSIVNTASVAGLRGTPAMVAYSSSKAAVLALTVCCAKVRCYTTAVVL